MRIEMQLTADQLGVIAAEVVAEMERQGKVMVEPERTAPYSISQAAEVLGVNERSVRRYIDAGRLQRVPGVGRVLIVADSLSQFQKGKC